MLTEPLVGRSRPPIRFKRVLFPEPDGPINARNSPFGTVRLRLERTWTCSEPRWKTFSTLSTWTSAPLVAAVDIRLVLGHFLDQSVAGQAWGGVSNDPLSRGNAG